MVQGRQFVHLFDLDGNKPGPLLRCGYFQLKNYDVMKNIYVCIPCGDGKTIPYSADLLVDLACGEQKPDRYTRLERNSEGMNINMPSLSAAFKISKEDIEALKEINTYWKGNIGG